MTRIVAAFVVAMGSLAAGRSGSAQTTNFACTGPADVCAFVRHFIATLNDHDWDGFRACLADDVTVLFDRPGPPERQDGRNAVEAFFRRAFPVSGVTPTVTLSLLRPQDVLVQPAGDAAVVSFLLRNPDSVSRRTLVVRKGVTGWQVIHIHASSMPVPAR